MITIILTALLPVFGLILLGFGCGRVNLLGDGAFTVLNRFVITLTLPVLTFRTLAHMRAEDLAVPSMIGAVLGGAFTIYAAAFAVERFAGRGRAEANVAGLSGCFSNTGFVGLPIALVTLGPASLAPVAVTMALYSSVVFGVAILMAELSTPGHGLAAGVKRAAHALSHSPLIMLSILGVGWSATGLALWQPLDDLLKTLAGATAPCALVAIGLFISLPRQSAAPGPIARIALAKLVLHPLATAAWVLLLPPMPPLWSSTAILMAAMPAGASSFVLAGGAGRWAMELSAWSIIATTTLAAISLVPFLWLLGGG